MTLTADTGNSATCVLTSTGLVGAGVREIGSNTQTGLAIPDDILTTTVRETCIPGDLYKPGTIEITLEHDVNVLPPAPHTKDTLTITQPLEPGSVLGRSTIAGTGFILERTNTGYKNNEIMVSSYIWQWDGKTGPTHTPEA